MDTALHSLITALHAAPFRCCLCLTGGGASATGWLLSVPGGSRTILEVAIPYNEQALSEYLGHRPGSSCSPETARLMAARAFDRAGWLASGEPVAGVACTASLRSDRPKRGDHRFHIAVHGARQLMTASLTLHKDARERALEEDILDRVLLNTMAEAFGLSERANVALLDGEIVEKQNTFHADDLCRFLDGTTPIVLVEPDGRCRAEAPRPPLILAGSFNPLHDAHSHLAAVASRLTGLPYAFELAVVNAEKGSLPDEEVRRRLRQFAWRAPVWLTRAATFPEKAELFSGATFVVGADTAERIVQARFYDGNADKMRQSLDRFCALGCRFVVAGRVDQNGLFKGLADLPIPANFADLFVPIVEQDFRLDLSSTGLRQTTQLG